MTTLVTGLREGSNVRVWGCVLQIDQSEGRTAGLRHVTKDMKSKSTGGVVYVVCGCRMPLLAVVSPGSFHGGGVVVAVFPFLSCGLHVCVRGVAAPRRLRLRLPPPPPPSRLLHPRSSSRPVWSW